jgi:hypothetical protein
VLVSKEHKQQHSESRREWTLLEELPHKVLLLLDHKDLEQKQVWLVSYNLLLNRS